MEREKCKYVTKKTLVAVVFSISHRKCQKRAF
jgi:hypothetical protein